MDKITIKVPDTPIREVELAPGSYRIGRAETADVRIEHPSVSSSHCELTIADGAMAVKDLGSTNGTMIGGKPVQDANVIPGQSMRLGDVEVICGAESIPVPALRIAFVPKIEAPVTASAPPPPRIPLDRPRRPKNFYKTIPSAFAYPFTRNGFLLLIAGTLIFGIFEFILNFRAAGFLVVGARISGLFGACIVGYIYLYLQNIILSSAVGEEHIPNWPDFENFYESMIQPFVRLVAINAACIAPAILCGMYARDTAPYLIIPLFVLGCLYLPMATLAVAMDDSLFGLNPLLVVPAIIRVPVEYLACCAMVGILFLVLFGLRFLTGAVLPEFVSQIIGMFISLYCVIVQVRLLGLLYYTKQDRFGWRK